MKRFLILSLALVGIICSCRKPINPEGEFNAEGTTQVAATGGDVQLHISSNVSWVLAAEQGVTVDPSSGGAGEYIVTATVAPNTDDIAKEFTITATFTSKEGASIQKELKLSIKAFFPEPKITLAADGKGTLPFYGGEFKYTLESNCAWVAVAPEGVVVDPASGEGGKFEVVATLPANNDKNKAQHTIKFTATNGDDVKFDIESTLFVEIPYVSDKDDNNYKIALLQDGRIWMTENMRVLPNNGLINASSNLAWLDPCFYHPLIIDGTGTVTFSINDNDIISQGLYYSTARAFGLASDDDLTAENAESFEACQGICPDGWHIPTAAEMIALIGKGPKDKDGKDISDYTAPYYDPAAGTSGGGSLAKLNEDGANFKAYGGITIANKTSADGTMNKTLNADGSDFNTGYFIGSTLYKATFDTENKLKNLQFFALMPSAKNGTMNVSYNNFRNGVSLRCIKNL